MRQFKLWLNQPRNPARLAIALQRCQKPFDIPARIIRAFR